MPHSSPRIAYLTAGAAGMYCGSCLHDNALVAALHRLGVDAQLLPTYTPILTDEQDVSQPHVLFGGVNVYLQQKFSLFRALPTWIDRILDQPWLIRWAASGNIETEASQLGDMTVSMLRGSHGRQKKEVTKLVDWLAEHVRPQLIVLSNMLIAGCVPELKARTGAPVLVTLQGDDIFLDGLSEPYKSQAFEEIRRLEPSIDGFLVNSNYYAQFMANFLGLPREKMHLVPLGLDVRDFQTSKNEHADAPLTVGYLARLAPEKGLHQLIDAYIKLQKMPGMEDVRLQAAGWRGKQHEEYLREQADKLEAAGLGAQAKIGGTVSRREKLALLHNLSVLSVPTTYHEPKGLFVLEALAAGVPVVQPAHGAFPELLASTGGGKLFRPGDAQHLAETLFELLSDHTARRELGSQGRSTVHSAFNAEEMAKKSLAVYQKFLAPKPA